MMNQSADRFVANTKTKVCGGNEQQRYITEDMNQQQHHAYAAHTYMGRWVVAEAYSGIGDEGNALEPASVWEAHEVQVLYLTAEAPVLTNRIHLRHQKHAGLDGSNKPTTLLLCDLLE